MSNMDAEEFPDSQQLSNSNNGINIATQGLEGISLSEENAGVTAEEIAKDKETLASGCTFDAEYAINGADDFSKIMVKDISAQNLLRFHFPDLNIAFMFYNFYASVHGFAARKSKVMRNCKGEITQQTFVCHREGYRDGKNSNSAREEGYRDGKNSNSASKNRVHKPDSRCGCEARCQVHIGGDMERWYVKLFDDVHNHTFVEGMYTGMLPAHRKMSEYDKFQMQSMRKIGISTPHIFGFLASQAGGYDRVGYMKRDLYNEQFKERRTHFSDAKAALDFLEGMCLTDDMLFWRHTVDQNGCLEQLFWCDGVGRRDYSVFGDVVAFDATYGKNKYKCPLVVFSGVNHHNQSVVFAGAIVVKETEQTYVWLLEQLLEAMGGKSPMSVITDGDLAMKNAIKRVFPRAHHRLCAWHLIRNATSNVKNAKFVSKFRQCMLGDMDVGEFQRKWDRLVEEFGLEENLWVLETYEKRKMWATAHIRGNFFAGFRTTSRCEGLHSEFGKYVSSHNSLLDFIQHFFRWLNYMRYKEVEADFSSSYGETVLQTHLPDLERSAASLYTKEVFLLFRPLLERTYTCLIVGIRQTATCFIYTISKYRREDLEWRVSFCPTTLEFKCSCMRLESLGIPCEHLLKVFVSLSIVNLPESVVLQRWTKGAKKSITVANGTMSYPRDSVLTTTYVGLMERCKRMVTAALDCGNPDYLRRTVDMVEKQTDVLESIRKGDVIEPVVAENDVPPNEGAVRNPVRVNSKGCGGASSSSQKSSKKTARKAPRCGLCGRKGHYRKSCHLQRDFDLTAQTQATSITFDDELDDDRDCANIETNLGRL